MREAIFDSDWRQRSSVHVSKISDVMDYMRAHYLRKRPAIALLVLTMTVDSVPVGCIVYSAPPREADKRYGGKTWELARLFIVDEVPKNAETWLIAKSVKHVRNHHPEVECLLSYADPSAGHSGTIYRAANWTQDGRTDQGRKTPRCDYVDKNTGKKYGRKGNMPKDADTIRVPRISKFRFIYDLRRGARK